MKPAQLLLFATSSVALAFSHKHGARLRGGSLAPEKIDDSQGLRNGHVDCPCIGIENITGHLKVELGGSIVHYPAEAGSYCSDWDNGNHQDLCLEGQTPGLDNGFCAQKWCWVDACNYKGIDTPPKVSQSGIMFQG